MWSSRSISRRDVFRACRSVLALAVAGALGLAGCAPAYVTDNQAPVLLSIASVNGGAALNSDVRKAPSAVVDDTVKVSVADRAKNPNFTNIPQVAMAIFIDRYEVSYYRSDGRGVQGVDVPYTISGNITTVVDVATSGTVDVPIAVVRAQAKLEPPLINLWGTTSGVLGGTALIVTMFAKITLSGHTIAGQTVEATGTLQINFADFPDTVA
jgi:hypothetical protein